MEVRRLSAKKEEIYQGLLGSGPPIVAEGVRSFLDTLSKNNVCGPLLQNALTYNLVAKLGNTARVPRLSGGGGGVVALAWYSCGSCSLKRLQ
jgi:hypothetical protein